MGRPLRARVGGVISHVWNRANQPEKVPDTISIFYHSTRVVDRLGLVDDSPRMRPARLRLVLGLAKDLGRATRSSVCTLGLGLRFLRTLLQRRPIRQSHHVFDPDEFVEEIEHFRSPKASVEPDPDAGLRKCRSHLREQSSTVIRRASWTCRN